MQTKYSFKSPSKFLLIICSILSIWAYFTPNSWHIISAIWIIPIIVRNTWIVGHPPVVFLGVLYQWLTITIKVFYVSVIDQVFSENHIFNEHINTAYYLSLIGILLLSFGFRLSINFFENLNKNKPIIDKQKLSLSFSKILMVYGIIVVASPFIQKLSYTIPGLQQPLFKFLEFRWCLFFLLYVSIKESIFYRNIFYWVVLAEVLLSLTGYFSNFKDYFIVFLIAFLYKSQRFTVVQYFLILITTTLLIYMALFWTHIKPLYRSFLSGGEQQQIVVVSQSEAFDKLTELYADFSSEDYEESLLHLIDRLEYIEFFSATISYIPDYLPHQNGKIWLEAIQHVLVPRFINPDKAVIDDSEQTNRLTGLNVSGADKGTSISLGYMAESYADFGAIGMFIPIFLFGFFFGFLYNFIYQLTNITILSSALVVPLYFTINVNGTPATKVLGSVIMFTFVFYLISKFLLPRLIIILGEKN